MSRVIAIIPARKGSKGIPGKNFRAFESIGQRPVDMAVKCAHDAGIETIVLTTDDDVRLAWGLTVVQRPPELASDTAPMIDVVRHALDQVPGEPDDIVLLVQPTQPLRQPKHLQAAIDLLQTSGADSVVSVVELPPTHHPEYVLDILPSGRLRAWLPGGDISGPARRQDVEPVFIRDGTVYTCRRRVVVYGLYGSDCRPLIISPEDTCPLDTPADWADAERRLYAREA